MPLHERGSEDLFTGSVGMVPLRIKEEQKVMSYYKGALEHFRQFNCRIIAKAFIKFIEPGKQAKHPYNGGKAPPGLAPGTYGDPEKSNPEWWPDTVSYLIAIDHWIETLGRYAINSPIQISYKVILWTFAR
jgi:hypothetical protein